MKSKEDFKDTCKEKWISWFEHPDYIRVSLAPALRSGCRQDRLHSSPALGAKAFTVMRRLFCYRRHSDEGGISIYSGN